MIRRGSTNIAPFRAAINTIKCPAAKVVTVERATNEQAAIINVKRMTEKIKVIIRMRRSVPQQSFL